MNKDTALFVVVVGLAAALFYMLFLRKGGLLGGVSQTLTGDTQLFRGIATTLFGEAATSGAIGAAVADRYVHIPEGQKPYLLTPVVRHLSGAENFPRLNVAATDSAFRRLGLTTEQVQRLQQSHPGLANAAIVQLTAVANGAPINALTNEQVAALMDVGWRAWDMPRFGVR